MPLARARTIVRIRQCMAARYRQGNWCEMLKGKTFKGSLRQGTLEIGEGCISGVDMPVSAGQAIYAITVAAAGLRQLQRNSLVLFVVML